MQKKVWVSFLVLWTLILPLYGQTGKSEWVDSVFNSMDLEAKIGQLLILPVEGHVDAAAIDKVSSQIKKFKIGGVVFIKGGPVAQINLTSHFQQLVPVPLMIGMSTETLPDSIQEFPKPSMLAAVRDDSLLYFLGAETGRKFNLLRANFIFVPTNSWGENQNRAGSKILAYQTGLANANIMSVPTFNTDATQNRTILSQILKGERSALYIKQNTNFALPDHGKLLSSKLTNVSNLLVEQFSSKIVQKEATFTGLTISSIPDIKKFNKKFRPGDSEVIVFRAGHDLLLFPENIGAAVRRIKKAVNKDKVLQKQLDESVKQILAVKFATQRKGINTENIIDRINTPSAAFLQTTLIEKSVTVVKDERQILPIKQLDNISFASLSIGETKESTVAHYLSKYTSFSHFKLNTPNDTVGLIQTLSKYNCVVVSIASGARELEPVYPPILQRINSKTNVIAVLLDTASKLEMVKNISTIILGFNDIEIIQKFIPQLIFGARTADGILPVSVGENFQEGQGIETSLQQRLRYSSAEAEGLDSKKIAAIDKIASEAITQKAAPGCQVLVARHGKILYEKNFGAQTYENGSLITDQTVYDLASLTKVMGTLQAVMFLYEKGLIDIYKKASVYLPELATTNKKDIILKDILTHQSGLAPFLLMWPQTVKGDTLLPHYYSSIKNESYPLHVAPELYASKAMQDSIWHWLVVSDMQTKPPRTPYPVRYSDLGFMILHRLVERLINQPIEDFLSQNLYEPIGATSVGYLPLNRFPPTQIAPTEMDTIFRKATVTGTVHDERAAMLGGVAGHAGLFGSGIDLIKVGQMLLQQGSYGGQQYYHPETIDLFSQKQFENSTRGLGWAKPGDPNSPSSRYGSPQAFGHTGFTGTCIWIDPEFDLVFVFLSNSRFPYRSGKLNTINIRSRIQDTIYQSIFSYCQYGDNEPDRKMMEYLRKTSN